MDCFPIKKILLSDFNGWLFKKIQKCLKNKLI